MTNSKRKMVGLVTGGLLAGALIISNIYALSTISNLKENQLSKQSYLPVDYSIEQMYNFQNSTQKRDTVRGVEVQNLSYNSIADSVADGVVDSSSNENTRASSSSAEVDNSDNIRAYSERLADGTLEENAGIHSSWNGITIGRDLSRHFASPTIRLSYDVHRSEGGGIFLSADYITFNTVPNVMGHMLITEYDLKNELDNYVPVEWYGELMEYIFQLEDKVFELEDRLNQLEELIAEQTEEQNSQQSSEQVQDKE